MKTYTPTIGIEVHAELKTNTKMFCNSKNDPHAGEPNTHVCPICMGHPGTLPVINKKAVEHILKVGIALGSELAIYTEFDRKNYFYPDMPKGYQISQYLYPFVKGGVLNRIAITRVHLEEDTARSLHDQGEGSIIDYNRAGVPLMELVTEPVIHDAKTAGDFARELQLLLRTLGVSDAHMEKGEMRVEANISVSDTDTFGTKVEVKNINSFKAVENAILYEIERQSTLLEKGEKVIQETRGWDEQKGKTFSQRIKESANDYRYFPDPDLPKMNVDLMSNTLLSRLHDEIPLLPDKKREKYSDIGLTRKQIDTIIGDTALDNFFQSACARASDDADTIKLIANYLVTDVLPLLQDNHIENAHIEPFVSLMQLISKKSITSRVAKDLLFEVLFEDNNPLQIIEERGLLQSDTAEILSPIVENIIVSNPAVVADFRNGKETALQYLVGQGMKATEGSVNPTALADLIRQKINQI